MKMDRKHMIYIAAGVGAVLILYMLYRRSQGGGSSQPTTDTIGSSMSPNAGDYANLAGEQQQLQANEQNDFQKLQDEIAKLVSNANKGGGGGGGGNDPLKKLRHQIAKLTKREHHQQVEIAAGKRREHKQHEKIVKLQHSQKKGTKNRPHNHPNTGKHPASGGAPVGHTNHHHPAGHAGHAVAPRSHAGSGHGRKR